MIIIGQGSHEQSRPSTDEWKALRKTGHHAYNGDMTTIYVLADQRLPQAADLMERLQQLVGARYRVESVPDLAALTKQFENDRQAVVFSGVSPEEIAALSAQCRDILPGTAFINLVTTEVDSGMLNILPIFEIDCLFLHWPADDFAILSQLSAAIRQAELLSSLADGVQLDEVTTLVNRRYFMQRLGEEISLSRRHLSPLCCVVLGISFYQMYLDSYGYDFINALVRFIADKTASMIRYEDLTARVSDDEIAILLPRSTEKGAKVFTNRLILNLNASVFKYGEYEEELFICAGVAGFPLPDEQPANADTILRYARHALYQAKHAKDEHIQVQLFSEIRPVL